MKKTYLLIVIIALSFFAFRAKAQEGVVIWQVVRFDLTVTLPQNFEGRERELTARALIQARNVGNAAGRTFTVRLNPSAKVEAVKIGDATAQFTPGRDARSNLQQYVINLPNVGGGVAPNGAITATIDYRLPVGENTGLLALSSEETQALPQSNWYPTPNTVFAPRGADYAPLHLSVNANGKAWILSSGAIVGNEIGKSVNVTFDDKLNGQPFFLVGNWEQVEGASKNASAFVMRGAGADEKARAQELLSLAESARKFFAETLGDAPEAVNAPIRLVAVRRGAGFSGDGVVLLDEAALRRRKIDAVTAQRIAEAMASLWLGGAFAVRGESSDVVREGLKRHLATLFIEKQFGRDAAEAERLRERIAYAAIAKRDAPLTQSSPSEDTHYSSAANKGAMVWRLIEHSLGASETDARAQFFAALRDALAANREYGVTLAALRSAFARRSDSLKQLLDYELDKPTAMDLLAGLPQQKGAEWTVALRNTGEIEVNVSIVAVSETGERLVVNAVVPARDFGEARFKSPQRLVRAEIDADKFYPQIDYSNDVAPRAPAPQEALASAQQLFAQNNFAEAERTLRELLARAPQMQDARALLGRALLGEKRIDDAEREFQTAVNDKLPTPGALAWGEIGLGEVLKARGQLAQAAKLFDEAARAEGDSASTLYARNARIEAENASNSAPTVDSAARDFLARLDAAIKTGRRAEIDPLIVQGELEDFRKGIVGSQPETWQTRVVRTERLDADHIAADVALNVRALGKDQSGTAVYVLSRVGDSLRLSAIRFFNVK